MPKLVEGANSGVGKSLGFSFLEINGVSENLDRISDLIPFACAR